MKHLRAASFVAILVSLTLGLLAADLGVSRIEINTLSVDADRVTGGDVLVQVRVPIGTPLASLKMRVDSRDVTSVFQSTAPNTFIGLVTGFSLGRNVLTVEAAARTTPVSTLEITNYPITGPVISGPWQQPFICQTDAFELPDGTKLGPPLDANCSARTVVQYVYQTRPAAEPTFKPLPKNLTAATLPADLAKTTTVDRRDRELHRPRRDRHDEPRHLSERDPARSDVRIQRRRRSRRRRAGTGG